MGVYLAKPKTEKTSEDGGRWAATRYGLTSMQGWRKNMEDAHIACTAMEAHPHVSLFGVFDGHGGPAVSGWISEHFTEEFHKNLETVKQKFVENTISVDTEVTCHLETAILQPARPSRKRTDAGSMMDIDNGNDADKSGEDDSDELMTKLDEGMVPDEMEEKLNPKNLSLETVMLCEALQKTFMSLDEKMHLEEARAQLKTIHDQLKVDEEEDEAGGVGELQKIQDLLKYYLEGDRNGVLRVSDNGSGQHVFQYVHGHGDGDDEGIGSPDYDDEVRAADDDDEEDEDDDDFKGFRGPGDDAEEESLAVRGGGASSKRGDVLHPNVEEVRDSDSDDSVSDSNGESATATAAKEALPSKEKAAMKDAMTDELSEATSASTATSSRSATKVKAPPVKVPISTRFDEDENSSEEEASSGDERKKSRGGRDTNSGRGEDGADEDKSGEDAADDAGPVIKLVPYEPEHCGSTAVVAAVVRGEVPLLIAANAGDSRIVLCRNGVAVPLSKDHKPNHYREARRIFAAGGRVVGGRVDGNLNLSRSIGDLAYKSDASIPQEAQRITSFPDIRIIKLTQEDEYAVIACDGIWDCMSNQDLVDLISSRLKGESFGAGADEENDKKPNAIRLSAICEEVCDRCLAQHPIANEGIGCDNMTMMIVHFGPELKKQGNTKEQDEGPRIYTGRLYQKV